MVEGFVGAGPFKTIQSVCRSLAMKLRFLLLLASLILAGCATPFRAPPDVAQIKLERVDSPVIIVEKVWLERKGGPLTLKGYVLKRLRVNDTTQTHLDVTLFDGSGRVLRASVERFTPQRIVKRFRRQSYASYSMNLDPLPAGTTRIEVRAHEGVHPSP